MPLRIWLVLVVEVADADVADRALVLEDALDDLGVAVHLFHVGRVVLVAEDELLHEDVRAGVGLPAVEGDGLLGAADGLPVLDLAAVESADLGHGQLLEGVLLVDDDAQAVDGHDEEPGRDALFPGLVDLLRLPLAGVVGDVAGLVDEAGDARARAAAENGDGGAGRSCPCTPRPGSGRG